MATCGDEVPQLTHIIIQHQLLDNIPPQGAPAAAKPLLWLTLVQLGVTLRHWSLEGKAKYVTISPSDRPSSVWPQITSEATRSPTVAVSLYPARYIYGL